MTIWKFTLNESGTTELSMPEGAYVLKVDAQHGHPVLWALVAAERVKEKRRFRSCLTGGDAPNSVMDYIGTVQLDGDSFVLHVFETK